MSNKTIAILDDEADILELIAVNLEKNGFEPVTFEFVEEFWGYLERCCPPPTPPRSQAHGGGYPALIVLDLMLNDGNGFDVCRQLKANVKYAHIPVIMLTARSEETEKIVGLEIGADDYITKPFSPRELVARIKVILKRVETQYSRDAIYSVSTRQEHILVINPTLQIDISKHEVRENGKRLDLTQTEFKLLKILAERRGWVFSREQLLNYLWGNDKIVIDRTIDVHIKNLREKLGENGSLIQNVRGVGYKMQE